MIRVIDSPYGRGSIVHSNDDVHRYLRTAEISQAFREELIDNLPDECYPQAYPALMVITEGGYSQSGVGFYTVEHVAQVISGLSNMLEGMQTLYMRMKP
jgi:hypothetical protein